MRNLLFMAIACSALFVGFIPGDSRAVIVVGEWETQCFEGDYAFGQKKACFKVRTTTFDLDDLAAPDDDSQNPPPPPPPSCNCNIEYPPTHYCYPICH